MIGVEIPHPARDPEVVWPELATAMGRIAPGVGVRVVLRELIGAVEVFPSLVITGSVQVTEEAIAQSADAVAYATADGIVASMRKAADGALNTERAARERERQDRLRTLAEVRGVISTIPLEREQSFQVMAALRELEARA